MTDKKHTAEKSVIALPVKKFFIALPVK